MEHWDDEVREVLKAHHEYLLHLNRNGVLLHAGRTHYPSDQKGKPLFGMIILCASDIEEARYITDRDPAVKAGIQRIELHPYKLVIEHE